MEGACRLGVAEDVTVDALIDVADGRLHLWQGRNQRGNPIQPLASHACQRLNQLLDYLESEDGANQR